MGILTEELKPYILETLGLSGYEEECEIFSVDGMIVGNIETAEYPYEDNYEYLTGLCYLPGELVLAMEESGFEVIEDEEQKKYARADTAEEEIEEDREETDEEEQKNRIIWSEQAYKLMRDFVREPQSRPEITVACALTVPEETDLRTYDMAYFQETRKRSGMNFQINLYLI